MLGMRLQLSILLLALWPVPDALDQGQSSAGRAAAQEFGAERHKCECSSIGTLSGLSAKDLKRDELKCIQTDIGCVIQDPSLFPYGQLLRDYGHQLPEEKETLSFLSHGRDVLLIAPESPFLVLSLTTVQAKSVTVIHPLGLERRKLDLTMQANRIRIPILPGIIGGNATSSQSAIYPPRTQTLSDFYSLRERPPLREAENVEILSLADTVPRTVSSATLVVVQDSSQRLETLSAVSIYCIGNCILVYRVVYDGEGVVFSQQSLAALQQLELHESTGATCFLHLSDWHVDVQGPADPFSHVPPVLDIMCLPPSLAASAPPATRVRWSSLHHQLKAMVHAFNPKFYEAHVFSTGSINPAVCTNFSGICRAPSNLRRFEPSETSRMGRRHTNAEMQAAVELRDWISRLQHQPESCDHGKILVYCYTNPKLAGHGAQFHAIAEAFTYSIAANRTLVLDDTCQWSLSPREQTGLGFWEQYLLPISSCAMQEAFNNAVRASQFDTAEEHRVLLWDSETAQQKLPPPSNTQSWCQGGGRNGTLQWSSQCIPPQYHHLGRAWWTSIVLGALLRPNEELQRVIEDKGRDLNTIRRPCIGIHLRQGHKYIEMPPAEPSMYQEEVLVVAERLFKVKLQGPRAQRIVQLRERIGRAVPWCSLFVATEDGTSLEAMKQFSNEIGAELHVIDSEHGRPNLRISIPMAVRAGLLDVHRENLVSLISMFVMARFSDFIVGSFSSGWSRLVMEVANSARGTVLPHVSMDVPYSI